MFEQPQRLNYESVDLRPDDLLIDIKDSNDLETPGLETLVVGEGGTQVPSSDDNNGMYLRETEDRPDSFAQTFVVVADAPCALRAEVGEILAYLR